MTCNGPKHAGSPADAVKKLVCADCGKAFGRCAACQDAVPTGAACSMTLHRKIHLRSRRLADALRIHRDEAKR